jgi:hypothetical protein
MRYMILTAKGQTRPYNPEMWWVHEYKTIGFEYPGLMVL